MKRAYAFQQDFFFCSRNFLDKSPHEQKIRSDNLAISGLDFKNTEGRVNIYRRLQNLGLIFFLDIKTLFTISGDCVPQISYFWNSKSKVAFSLFHFMLNFFPKAFIKENSIAQNKMKNSTLKSNMGFRRT